MWPIEEKIQKPTVGEICMVGKFYSLSNDIVTCGLVTDGVTSGVITSNNNILIFCGIIYNGMECK